MTGDPIRPRSFFLGNLLAMIHLSSSLPLTQTKFHLVQLFDERSVRSFGQVGSETRRGPAPARLTQGLRRVVTDS